MNDKHKILRGRGAERAWRWEAPSGTGQICPLVAAVLGRPPGFQPSTGSAPHLQRAEYTARVSDGRDGPPPGPSPRGRSSPSLPVPPGSVPPHTEGLLGPGPHPSAPGPWTSGSHCQPPWRKSPAHSQVGAAPRMPPGLRPSPKPTRVRRRRGDWDADAHTGTAP